MKIPSSVEDEETDVNKSSEANKDDQTFSFTPQQAHMFGGQSIFLTFTKLLDVDFFYYLVFKGSKIRHITSTKVLNPYTLQAVIPDHDRAELVSLNVCQFGRSGETQHIEKVQPEVEGDKIVLATETFTFTSDSSQFLAQQLITNSLDPSSLQKVEEVYALLLKGSAADRHALDTKLTTTFRSISKSTAWTLVGEREDQNEEKSWNLLHFCTKYCLYQLTEYLLSRKDARTALKCADANGLTPFDIANKNGNKKLVEILSRVPCEEDIHCTPSDKNRRPSVKRHKLGTTTITNSIGEGDDNLVKDLMVLKEVHQLAAASEGKPSTLNGEQTEDEMIPLAESLKKLQEINDEIRRLRSISYKENIDQYEKEMNGELEPNYVADALKGDDDEDGFIDIALHEANNNNNMPDNKESPNVSSPAAVDAAGMTSVDNAADNSRDLDEVEEKIVVSEERRPSNTSLMKIEECVGVVKVERCVGQESIEIVPGVEEVRPKVTEVTLETTDGTNATVNPETTTQQHTSSAGTSEEIESCVEECELCDNVDEEDGTAVPGDLKFKLESVMEETEEELKADGSGRSPVMKRQQKGDSLVSMAMTKSLTELPPHPPKRVGILKRQGCTKKDRPLSDSFENLKMVENQGIVELYEGSNQINTNSNTAKSNALQHGHSLDALMSQTNQEEPVRSEPSTASQASIPGTPNNRIDSQESLTSDCESPKCRSRSGSDKMSVSSQRASSLSLNDAQMSHGSSISSQDDLQRLSGKKSGSSLLRMFSVKKAKSMSSLDVTNEKLMPEEDRRKTIIGDVGVELRTDRKTDSKEDLAVVSNQDMYGDISYESDVKKSQSTASIDTVGKDGEKEQESPMHRRMSTSALPYSCGRRFTNSDEDTDEGTSTDIAEKQNTERKTNADDKSKRRFKILRKPKDKDKKSVKEKDKSESKGKKKPPPVPSTKPDSKSSNFLTKRGSSFRKPPPDIKGSDKQMFTRGNSANNNANKLRVSERKSPNMSRKFSNVHGDNGISEHEGDLLHSKNLSSSRTSIDSLGLDPDDTDFSPYTNYSYEEPEYDSDLDADDEQKTWSELVDKKVQRKMHAKDIKRQDVIYELIQTEAVYVRTLYVMKKLYSANMVKLNFDEQTIQTIFPELDELIDLNGGFLKDMKIRQEDSTNSCIENIGDILVDFFAGEKGERLKIAYGSFCSRHLQAVAKHKELLKADKKFAACMKKCLLNERSRRLSIPECITYVTLRMTKYPLLIEAIIKATKEAKPDYENLKKSLNHVRECLDSIDNAVEEYEQRKELENLKKILDRKNVVEIKVGQTKAIYRTNKLFHKHSKLLCDKKTILRGKNKHYETRMVVLSEKIIFFQENSGKLQLLQGDNNKAPVLSLKNLMVREVATDIKALFLVSTSKDAAQIYEIICDSYKDTQEFMTKLKGYIKKCPEEEEVITDNEEEAKREEEERQAKLRDIVDQLQLASDNVNKAFADKNRLVGEMREIIENMNEIGTTKGSVTTELKPSDIVNARETLEACINELNTLSTSFPSSPNQPDVALSPGPLSSISGLSNSVSTNRRMDSYSSSMRPSFSSGNVNSRSVSTKPTQKQPSSITETDSGPNKRRQSQFMSVIGRTKASGSTEDLTSLASSSSLHSVSSLTSTMSQMQLFQNLRDHLVSLVDVTSKQDVEIGKMRLDLQQARNEITKLRTERKELEDRFSVQQRESDRNLRNEYDKYSKLAREFKRTTERMQRQMEELKAQKQLRSAGRQNSDDAIYL